MCNFSVVAKNQRDYRSGEKLVITQLGPYTRGTASLADRETAVCLRSGCGMSFPNLPAEMRSRLGLPPTGGIPAIFMTLPNRAETYRDAFLF